MTLPAWTRGPVQVLSVLLAAGLVACSQEPSTTTRNGRPVSNVASAPRNTVAPAVSSSLPHAATIPPPPAASSTQPPPVARTGELREVTWSWDDTPVGRMRVVVTIPTYAGPEHKLPVLIAMHGKGEARKGPDKGARGWIDDYWLPKAVRRLHDPPLERKDLLGFVEAKRLRRINRSLEKTPYEGLIVACPYTPDSLRDEQLWDTGKLLAAFLVDELLPKLRRETPASQEAGVDGVSLGGRAAIVVGLERPEAFRVVGGVQAAFDAEDAPDLARRAADAVKKNPKLVFRLLTSEHDYYLAANRAISREMSAAGVANTLLVVPGPHAYEFNRGPGVIEMLLLHDRALRGRPSP